MPNFDDKTASEEAPAAEQTAIDSAGDSVRGHSPVKLPRWLNGLIEAVSAILAKKGVPFALALLAFAIGTVPIAVMRSFWYDELAMQWIAEAPSFDEMINRTFSGLEPVPPLYLFIHYGFARLFGLSEWAARLPAIAGFAAALIFLYRFVAQRAGAVTGGIAMLILTLSGAGFYAREGRPYGLVFACAAIALWAWQRYNDRGERRALIVCGAALAAAPSLHYYSVLLAVPFGVVALYKSWAARRIDWVSIGLSTLPGIPMLLHYPLIQRNMRLSSDPALAWSQPTWAFPEQFWSRALGPGILVFVGVSLLVLFQRATDGGDSREPEMSPAAEKLLLAAFTLIPLAGILLAKLVTNAIAPRYALSAMIGFTPVLAFAAARTAPNIRNGIFVLLLLVNTGNGLLDIRWQFREQTPGQFAIPAVSGEPLPAVIDDYLLYAQLGAYAKPEVLSRLYYVTDHERLRRYTRAGQMETQLVRGIQKGQFKGNSADLMDFARDHARFLLFEPLRPEPNEAWLARDLADRGFQLRLLTVQGGRWYLVDRGQPAAF